MKFSLSALLLAATLAATAHAQEVGNEGFVVPPLSCFPTAPTLRYDMTAVVSDLSGITYNPSTGTLFAVNNGDRMVYEIDFPNTLVQSWNVSAYTLDLEGISAMGGRNFAITDENPASVITVTLNEDGTVSNDEKIFDGLENAGFEAAGSNLGFEGVAYLVMAVNVSATSRTTGGRYIMAQEAAPTRLWTLDETFRDIAPLTGDLKNSTPYSIWSIGGLTRGGDATNEVFVVVKSYMGEGYNGESYFQKGIFRVDLESGDITERFGGDVCNMGQPEGLTFYKNETSNKIVMLVVGETYEARMYEASMDCTDSLGDINSKMNMTTCDKPIQTVAACEKTLEDGGCGWLRCDKDITDHTKICTDDEPGVTDCSQEECMDHCTNSNFGEELAGSVCTHWAYDVAEKECYIFSGCNNEKFDLDYTLYATQDLTCERTIEDYPLGCEQRRCNKDISVHNKICVDDIPGETDCTIDECKAFCESHTDFLCTTYAYDLAGKECYLFETCVDEGFDEDYSLYVLIDATCDKDKKEGGCFQRRCDKDITPHEKICVDDTPEQQCSIEECEMHCAIKTFDDIGSEAFCTHWAYDEVDRECYLFHGCMDEKYDDDYVLFTQSYGERISLIAGEESDGSAGSEGSEGTDGSEASVGSDGSTCAVVEDNEDDFCMRYIDRLPANTTCDCYDFCDGQLVGCLAFGEEPEEYDDCIFPRFGCSNDQGVPGSVESGAFKTTLLVTVVSAGLVGVLGGL